MNLDRDATRASIRSIIFSIKALEEGFVELADGDPLFSRASDSPSPVNFDSLDALDLAMCLGNEFGLDNEEFDRLIDSDGGLERLRTINDITDLVLSLTNNATDEKSVYA